MPPYSSHFHPLEILLNRHGENLNFSEDGFELGTNSTIRLWKLSLHRMVSSPWVFFQINWCSPFWGCLTLFVLILNPFLTILISSFHQKRFLGIV